MPKDIIKTRLARLRPAEAVLKTLDRDRGRHAFSVGGRIVSAADYKHYVLYRDGWQCTYCGFTANDFWSRRQLTADHLVGKKAGGANDLGNLVCACHQCNMTLARVPMHSLFGPRLQAATSLSPRAQARAWLSGKRQRIAQMLGDHRDQHEKWSHNPPMFSLRRKRKEAI